VLRGVEIIRLRDSLRDANPMSGYSRRHAARLASTDAEVLELGGPRRWAGTSSRPIPAESPSVTCSASSSSKHEAASAA